MARPTQWVFCLGWAILLIGTFSIDHLRAVRLGERAQASPGRGEPDNEQTLLAAIHEKAVLRVRPKAMTVAIVMAGSVPMMWGDGTGSEFMARIAAPIVGGWLPLRCCQCWLCLQRGTC